MEVSLARPYAGIHNRDKNKVTIPNLRSSMAHDGSRTITNKMIHAGTIDSGGEGLWIPKSSRGRNPKPIGRCLICFTGVTTTQSDAIRKGFSKRRRSEFDSYSGSDSD